MIARRQQMGQRPQIPLAPRERTLVEYCAGACGGPRGQSFEAGMHGRAIGLGGSGSGAFDKAIVAQVACAFDVHPHAVPGILPNGSSDSPHVHGLLRRSLARAIVAKQPNES